MVIFSFSSNMIDDGFARWDLTGGKARMIGGGVQFTPRHFRR